MYAVPNVRLSLVAAACLAASVFSMEKPANAGNQSLLFDPPKLDYKAVCKSQRSATIELKRDWSQWNGERLDLTAAEATAIALEYLSGSERVERSPTVALKILKAAEKAHPAQKLSLQLPIARALLRNNPGSDAVAEAEQRLLYAYDRGVLRAAFALGQFYGDGGPSDRHDPQKSRYYFEKASLASDPDGLMEYARIVSSDANSSNDVKRIAITNALVGLIGQIKNGDCSALSRIGFLYLRGKIVDKDIATALKWLEAFAKTGDSKAAMNLSQIYMSNQVDQIDTGKSVTYLRQAADGGIASAQLSMGKAFATGIPVAADRKKAIQYLEAASRQGVSEADAWLARIYSGEFGDKPDPALANSYFQKAIVSEQQSSDVSVKYGKFLARFGSTEADLDKTIAILQKAAEAGSVEATNTLGRIYLDMGQKVPSNYTMAFAYFSKAAKFGNSDAAAKLSEMYACGRGTTISVTSSNNWRQKAAIYGSVYSILAAGLNLLESSDKDQKNKGRNYVIQAAFKGHPEAIGYVVARWEKGADGFEQNPAAAARLLSFVERNPDSEARLAASIAVIRNRFDVAETEKEKLAQIGSLAPYLEKGEVSALAAEFDMIDRAGRPGDKRLLQISKLLAEKGDPRGMRNYGKLLLAQSELDVSVGRRWLEKAKDAGDLKAKLLLIDPAGPNAADQLESIAASGKVCKIDDMVSLAQAYFSLPDPKAKESARSWLELARSVVGRNSDDLYTLGAAYLAGVGGNDHVSDAEDLYLRALELGRKSVLRDLAEGHLQGRWKNSDPEKAKAYLLELNGQGDKEAGNKYLQEVADGKITADAAQLDAVFTSLGSDLSVSGRILLKLARLSNEGRFGPKDPKRAIRWLALSAEAGEPNAMYRLYQAYFFGDGVPKDVPQALHWLEKAAEGGKEQAIREISVAYRLGLEGFSKDPSKAEFWEKRLRDLKNETE